MGAHQSTNVDAPNASASLDTLSRAEVAEMVASYGSKYEEYKSIIAENGIDGAFLRSINEEEFLETLDDLCISHRIHRRKLLNEFRRTFGGAVAASPQLPRSSIMSCTSIASSVTGPTSIYWRNGISSDSNVSDSSDDTSSSDCCNQTRTSLASISSLISAEVDSIIMSQLEETQRLHRRVLSLNNHERRGSIRSSGPPQGTAALVLTDIEGSTSLWEQDPQAMSRALHLHNDIIRRLITTFVGYEVNTEGDAFHVAFHDSADALSFALRMQEELNAAPWSQDILALPWAQDNNGRRGLRVRVAVHMGTVQTRKDSITGRIRYFGEAMDVAKSLEAIARGGQIMTTYDTYQQAFEGVSSICLGAPLVDDRGMHTIPAKKRAVSREPTITRILEVAPSMLSIVGTPEQ